MNTKGKFSQSIMNEKSEALENSKQLFLSFSQILNDLSPNSNLEHVLYGLDHILNIFEVLDHIVIDYELAMIKPHIHSIFGCIINTNMFEKFIDILNIGEGQEEANAKISTLRILCHLSSGINFFNPNLPAPLIADDGFYNILGNNLSNAELLIKIRDCIRSDCVEVVEQA